MTDIDRKKLDKAREWAEHVQYGKALDDVQAAREVIQSLPDEWVDGATVRGLIEEMAESLAAISRSDFAEGHDKATERWRSALEALLPAPRTMSDIEWDDEHQGLEAFYRAGAPSESVVRMIFPVGSDNNDLIMCVEKSGRVFTPYSRDLTPIPGTKIDLAPNE